MKTKKIIALMTAVLCFSLFVLAGCGEENFANYMKDQPSMRSSIDAQLAVVSSEAKGTVKYQENVAEVTVDYYALTQKELEGAETDRMTERCRIILQDAVDQYHKDTGGTAEVKIILYGHDAKKQ